MDITPLEPFGVALGGFDADDLEHLAIFDAAYERHGLVVVRSPSLTLEHQQALVGRCGTVLDEGGQGRFHSHIAHDPAVERTSAAEAVFVGPLSFHSDLTYISRPHDVLSLAALEIPNRGGDTHFAHMGRALASLPHALRARIDGLVGRHVLDAGLDRYGQRFRERELRPRHFAAEHPVVRRHPRRGIDTLFVNRLLTDRLVGLDEAASEALLDELFSVAYAPANVYVHRWRVGDLVLWDNQLVQHARGDSDRSQRRILRRVIAGDPDMLERHNREFAAQLAAPAPHDGRAVRTDPGTDRDRGDVVAL